MAAKVTYQDYLKSVPDSSEGGTSGVLTEAEWNRLSPAEQVQNIRNGLTIGKDDPRYADLFGEVGGEAGRSIHLNPGEFDTANRNAMGVQRFTDPSKVVNGPGYHASNAANATPDAQKQGGFSDKDWAVFLALLAAGGYAAGGGLGGVAGAGEAGAGAGAMDFSALPALEPTTVGSLGPGFEIGAVEGGSGLASLGAAGGGGEIAGPPASAMNLGGEALPGVAPTEVGSLGPSFNANPSLLQQAGNYVSRNPGQVGRAVLGLSSLGAGGASGSGGGGGGGGDSNSIIEQMAQANRMNHNTPIGSRSWTKDANGQWTVNDTMNPREQANFENVQGLNASATEMARARFAALLAQPTALRADRPLTGG